MGDASRMSRAAVVAQLGGGAVAAARPHTIAVQFQHVEAGSRALGLAYAQAQVLAAVQALDVKGQVIRARSSAPLNTSAGRSWLRATAPP